MKRDKNLINLSSEHHDGLVISLRIKKALDKSNKYQEIVDYINHKWESLKNQFNQEEENFLQSKNINKEDKLIKRMLNEHIQFKELVNRLSSGNDSLKKDLTKFSELLNDHIRFEERELFPYIEKSLTEEELKLIGINLEKTHQNLDKNWGP